MSHDISELPQIKQAYEIGAPARAGEPLSLIDVPSIKRLLRQVLPRDGSGLIRPLEFENTAASIFKMIYKEGLEMTHQGYEIVVTNKPPGWQAAIYPIRPNLPRIDWESEPINEMTETAAREKARSRIDEALG